MKNNVFYSLEKNNIDTALAKTCGKVQNDDANRQEPGLAFRVAGQLEAPSLVPGACAH